ncbi:MAG: hypothetical protein K2I46_06335 [Clostridia bacterium]|nr:hypothetical protein [Clostridia bacterium]
MPYQKSKVYYDGSHYIATPQENYKHGKGSKRAKTTPTTHRQSEIQSKFETAYAESQSLPKRERKQYIAEKLQSEFSTAEQATDYVEQNIERKKNNLAKRRVRLWRKIYLQEWNYFVTFTYDSQRHTEETFKAKLRNTLKHLVSRKEWKYIGVWERSPDKQRLHFHGIFSIPQMIGTLEKVNDYSTKSHRKQITYQNTHFLKYFGRNDFKEISAIEIPQAVRYLLKYIEKSGEKLVYGGDLPTYLVSDILDEDIVCPIGIEDKKALLFDDFTCVDDGLLMGKVSTNIIKQMPKAN